MNPRLRQQRSVFLLFLGACFVALIAALPIVTAQVHKDDAQTQSAAGGASQPAPAPEHANDFDKADRNKDGFLDKSECGMVPGLSANFERADRNGDGKLDRDEFAQGLQILQVRR
ncbi:MAG TPA: EF-hand domain-containing protein [Burkholderiales bacterium]|jgi:hypothetical protein